MHKASSLNQFSSSFKKLGCRKFSQCTQSISGDMKDKFIYFFLILLIAMSPSLTQCSNPQPGRSASSDSISNQALRELQTNLVSLSKWDKVHAAEYLIWLGHYEGVYETYKQEEGKYGQEPPYRIGIWRVLAQSAPTTEEKQRYIQHILEAFKDPAGPDRLHASETLTKLHVSLLEHAPHVTANILKGEKTPLFVYTLAGASFGNTSAAKDNFAQLFSITTDEKSGDQLQMQGAYALRHVGKLSDASWAVLAQTALDEPEESLARVYLLSSALVTAPKSHESSETFSNLHKELLKCQSATSKGARAEMAAALAQRGTERDLTALYSLLNNENPLNAAQLTTREEIIASPENADVRSAAAYAILKIRSEQGSSR